MISLARVDERLIHGQVAYAWSIAYPADALIVVDEQAAKDRLQESLLKMACPRTLKCFVAGETRAIELIKKYPNKRFILVAKHPKSFLELMENGIEMKSVNVGGIYYKEGRRQVTNTVYLDEETTDVLKKIGARGVYLDGRTTPSDGDLDLMTKL